MKKEEVDKFEKIQSQLEGLYKEIGVLSKKSPNDAVNKFKLKFINQILIEANNILIDIYLPLEGFTTFEEDNLPSNSDVTFIFEQYLNCLEKLRSDNVVQGGRLRWHWIIDGEESDVKTCEPKKLRNK
jgi:hypothetical protein